MFSSDYVRMKNVLWLILGMIITVSGCVTQRGSMENTITNIIADGSDALYERGDLSYQRSAHLPIALATEKSVYRLPQTVRAVKANGTFVDVAVIWKDTKDRTISLLDKSFIDTQLVLTGMLHVPKGLTNPQKLQPILYVSVRQEMRGLWISYLDYALLIQKKSIAQAQANIINCFKYMKNIHLNTAVIHVRPFSDAVYPSRIFPSSQYVTSDGKQGTVLEWDPLSFMIEEAHKRNIEIHAWINPYRVSTATQDEKMLSPENPARRWIESGGREAIAFNGHISYNPANCKAQELIVAGVEEVVRNYDIDGIHFDDYFYPTTDECFDKQEYDDYCAQGGTDSVSQWRRNTVSDLIAKVYKAVHAIKDIPFGISPQGNNDNNLNNQYADTVRWLSQSGYVDYIVPQIYFGFKNNTNPFEATVREFDRYITIPSVALYVGISAYKVGAFDQWAGSQNNASSEWITDQDMLKRMISSTRHIRSQTKDSAVRGFMLYGFKEMFLGCEADFQKMQNELLQVKNLFCEIPTGSPYNIYKINRQK